MKRIFAFSFLICNTMFSQTDCVDLSVYTTQYLDFVTNDDNAFPVGSSFLTSSGNGWINYIKLDNNDTYDSIVGDVLYFSGGIGIDVSGPLCSNRSLTFSSGSLDQLIIDGIVVFNQSNPQSQFSSANFTVNWNGLETYEVIGNFQQMNIYGNQNSLFDVCFVCQGLSVQDNLSEIEIYPNPFIDQLFFQVPNQNYRVQILDLYGKLVFECLLQNDISTLNLSFLNNGLYNLRLSNENLKVSNYKILKCSN